MTGAARIYLDTNTLIYAVEDISERAALLNALLDASVRHTSAFLATSELSLAELLVKPLRAGQDDLVKRYHVLIRTSDWLDVYPVSRQVLVRAGDIRAGSRLKLPDAIHLATAQLVGCTHLLTGDAGFASVPAVADLKGHAPIVVRPDIPTLTTLLESLSP
ncbi:putative nucleic acid-binding protein [Rhizobium sp. PP-F2F-G48]|uniref:type II toxin-antitoxin system VapC family toxin n=1 Tax=Rhizobium sp. PP-F2F-G48 TaxID=2135651 RepID=UPI001052A024|nr:PIN domain-containing protein [Rhizobium sp. PP-F2F-G48]TCM54334.1 putative nucleic acid-binding protein [Rhizobium sp. PP-F2F-G48]